VLERLVEQQQRLTEEVMRVGRTLSALGARWGYLAEDAFRQGMEAIVADWLGMTVTKWRYWDEAGIVFGRPAWVEVDVVIHDDRHIPCPNFLQCYTGRSRCLLPHRATV
jgi:Uncharacterized conserved protein containing a coiled-coil domain